MLPSPLSPYAVTKLAGEYYCRVFQQVYGLPTVCLRYFNVYGPRQPYDSAYMDVIMHFLNRIEKDEAPLVRGDGSATVDLVYVEDVAQANIIAMKSKVTNEFFNVASGKEITLKNLAKLLIRLKGKEGQLYPKYERMDSGLVTRRSGDPARAREMLGFVAKTSVEEGMQKVIAWREELTNKGINVVTPGSFN